MFRCKALIKGLWFIPKFTEWILDFISQGTFVGNFVSDLASSVINIWCEWLSEWAFGNRYRHSRHRTRENTSNSPRLLQNQIYFHWCFKTTCMLTLSWKRSYHQNSQNMAIWSPVDSNLKSTCLNLSRLNAYMFLSSQFVCTLFFYNKTYTESLFFPLTFSTYMNTLLSSFLFSKPMVPTFV